MARTFSAQLHPLAMKRLSSQDRFARLVKLCRELYGTVPEDDVERGVARDMRMGLRQVRRWFRGGALVPLPVLVAFGAMLAAKRMDV